MRLRLIQLNVGKRTDRATRCEYSFLDLNRKRTMFDATRVDTPTLLRNIPHSEAPFHAPLPAVDAANSTRNIALWDAYLPTACVSAMVRMGWDYTT
jgi:hypothetical protein